MFEQRLKQSRLDVALTQQALAERLFVSRQTVSSWETGRNLPNLETLARLAAELDVTTDYLLGRPTETRASTPFGSVVPVLAILVCMRLSIATSGTTLLLEDAVIIGLAGVWLAQRHHVASRPVTLTTLSLGASMLAFSWGNIFEMEWPLQFAYSLAGALLTSEMSCEWYQHQLTRRLIPMKSKALWFTNGALTLVFISLAAFILTRHTDATGFVETPKMRAIELAILAGLALIIAVVELIGHWFIKRLQKTV
ncbi:DUF3923 family protein [Lacticaseibacillus daqingensis]|uniref:DUF3923 family protein n=1 Tax=Lacticaseibacillus daqingensis TaxID=2486014 RepID=UPI000F79E177|nr:DUF3923 family protein [Lacticaseibacillus daqingensis]